MVIDYSKWNNLTLTSDDEKEEENLDMLPSPTSVRSNIRLNPQDTEKLVSLHEKIQVLATFVEEDRNELIDITDKLISAGANHMKCLLSSQLESQSHAHHFLLINWFHFRRLLTIAQQRAFLELMHCPRRINSELFIILNPHLDRYWYMGEMLEKDDNALHRWYSSWFTKPCSICYEDVGDSVQMTTCSTCYSNVCQECSKQHREANHGLPMFKCPICRGSMFEIRPTIERDA